MLPRVIQVKPMHTETSKNPFKDGKDEFPVDEALNELEVLGRYDSMLRAFVLRGYFKLYKVWPIINTYAKLDCSLFSMRK